MTRAYVKPVRADERFARLLEVSSPAAAAGDELLGSLAAIANALRTAGHATGPAAPDPAFRAALRQRLVAVATVQAADPSLAGHRARPAFGYRAQRRIAALAGTIAIATSFAGIGVASARSLPGSPFYDLKRGTEAVQLWTAHGDLAKGKRHLEFARTRLAEAEALNPSSSHLASTLAAMNTQTTDGAHELIAAYQSSKSLTPLADLLAFSRQQIAELTKFAPTLPASLRATELGSVGLLTGVEQQVRSVSNGACVLCSGPGTPSPNGQSTPPVTPTSQAPQPGQSSGSGSPHPTTPPTVPATGHTSLPTVPTHVPTSLLPTVPTKLPTKLPSKLPTALPSLTVLHHKHPHPLPILSSLIPGL